MASRQEQEKNRKYGFSDARKFSDSVLKLHGSGSPLDIDIASAQQPDINQDMFR